MYASMYTICMYISMYTICKYILVLVYNLYVSAERDRNRDQITLLFLADGGTLCGMNKLINFNFKQYHIFAFLSNCNLQ